MSDVTRILSQIEDGDGQAAEQLLPLVYDELRKLAAAKMAQEKPGQTLQATALVHEAYLRLVDVKRAQHWDRSFRNPGRSPSCRRAKGWSSLCRCRASQGPLGNAPRQRRTPQTASTRSVRV